MNVMSPDQMRPSRLPDGHRAYVIGDVHGTAQLLARVFARIDEDLLRSPAAVVTQILLGDLIDRGPESETVLRMVINRQLTMEMICLAGNHELYMLEALENQNAFDAWMDIGGDATVKSFGITPPPQARSSTAFRNFGAAVSLPYRQFLSRLLPLYRLGDYLFVHAGIMPGIAIAQQSIVDLTLIRSPFLTYQGSHGYVVVHGHTPVPQIDIRNNRINVDTGAVNTGNLTCIAIEGDVIRML